MPTYCKTISNFIYSNQLKKAKMKATTSATTATAPKKAKKVSRTARLNKFSKQFAKNGEGLVGQIVKLAKKGFTRQELIEAGYNKNTVHRQVREKVDLA